MDRRQVRLPTRFSCAAFGTYILVAIDMNKFMVCLLAFVSVFFGSHSLTCAQTELPTEVADSMQLRGGTLIELAIDTTAGEPVVAAIEIEGESYELELHPQNIRSDKFIVKEQLPDGSLRTIAPPVSRTITGALRGDKGSNVVGSVLADGLAARITMSNGKLFFIEPVSLGLADDKPTVSHVMYRRNQVRPVDVKCGNADGTSTPFEAVNLSNQMNSRLRQLQNNGRNLALGAQPVLAICEVGVDADFEYFSAFGSTESTIDQVELILNMVNDQYENEVAIRHEISGIVVRTGPDDPYTLDDSTGLLGEFSEEWTTNQSDIPRDIAHLFTGRFTPGIGGAAFLGTICSFGTGFGFSSGLALDLPLSCDVQIAAHELGHNWGANHCDCVDNTMFASVNCSSSFAQETRDVITSSRNTRPCLEFTAPANDDFNNRIEIFNLPAEISGETRGGSTQVDEQNLESTGATVWWTVVANETGIMRVELDGSTFDTQLQIYEAGESGLISDLRPVAFNDDDQDELQSAVSFPVTAGERYEIRVGGVLVGANSIARTGCVTMSVEFSSPGPVDFFWSDRNLNSGAENNSNATGEFAAGSSGSIFLYYDATVTDIDSRAFVDIATSDGGVIEFTSAECLEFDISVKGIAFGQRWGDLSGNTGDVGTGFIDELGGIGLISGFGMVQENTGAGFFDQGFDTDAGAFLFAQVDFEVVGNVGDAVNIIANRGASLIETDGQFLDPVIGSFAIQVTEPEVIIGDVNCDGEVNLLDVGPFLDVLGAGSFSAKADINGDGVVNLLDVGPFVDLLAG